MINQLKSHGETITYQRVVEKILRSISPRFESLVVMLEEHTYMNVDVFVTSECIHLYILYFIGPRCSYWENHLYFFVPRCSYREITKSHEEVPFIVSWVSSTLVVVTQAYITELGILDPT